MCKDLQIFLVETILHLLKLVSAIFYQIFILSSNDSPLKTEKCFLFHLKSSFRSRDIQTQKDKWDWNNL